MENAYKKIWVQVAGNSKHIKDGLPTHWQCFINKTGDSIPIKSFQTVGGVATSENMIPGVNPNRNNNGLLAWIDYYGDVVIENGVLKIALLNPEK